MADDREAWNERYRGGAHQGTAPAAFIAGAADRRSPPGRVLDVAAGAGRNGLFLASRGFDVTLADVSDVALELAVDRARQAGVAIHTVQVDLERESLPPGPWDVIVCFHYLQRSLFPAFARALAPGGELWFCQPTVRNLERHSRPSARFLVDEGETRRLADGAGLSVVSLDEGWSVEGRHEARLIASKSPE